MHKSFLLLGSNQGNSRQILQQAIEDIHERAGEVVRVSSVYRTESWGFASPDAFLNRVVEIKTTLLPEELLTVLLAIESGLGRIRNGSKGYISRTIDIDILFFDDMILQLSHLTLPHPRMHLRRFTLVPLNEIAPELTHPVLRKKMSELLESCSDQLAVELSNE